MAKLEGVKTLDMVNGEITKVAYGGAAYERVEGSAQVSDLIMMKNDVRLDTTPGALYYVVSLDEGRAEILDDVDHLHTWTSGYYDLFRKVVAASKPSVEDRVSTLESDVAALKGESKTEYVRVDCSEARAGDFVKFDEAPLDFLTAGKYYEIEEFDSEDPVITDDDGDRYDTCGDYFEVYRKASAASVEAEPKPDRLQVGDYAKVVQEYHHQNGEIIILRDSGSERSDTFPFQSERLDGTTGDIFGHRHLVRATDEEVAEAKREAEFAKFKEGDKVRLKSGGGEFPLNGYENGKVYEVGYVCFPRDRIRIIGGNACQGFATPDQLEILSEEEAEEHKKWAEIGREVGEYKVGDIFRNPDGILYEVTRIDDRLEFPIRFTNLEGDDDGYTRKANLTLITPVEARFDR
ncbi:hypothetical protein [Bacillus halotolerans]|uniref:hypothetical protein n=1 Tax=Bacillus halotolerans TaxID=260554 RepID=UPI00227F60FB|nr:hypothetical protein [Bacillus halotolerans]MCY8472406.1 hypothetical protein [Bacillus halotolerans]